MVPGRGPGLGTADLNNRIPAVVTRPAVNFTGHVMQLGRGHRGQPHAALYSFSASFSSSYVNVNIEITNVVGF